MFFVKIAHNHVKNNSVFYQKHVSHTPLKMNANRYLLVLIQMKVNVVVV